jgi:hypothetical protein
MCIFLERSRLGYLAMVCQLYELDCSYIIMAITQDGLEKLT